jgi:hypothetical protein
MPCATCTTHLAPCTLHHAPCTLHHAPRTMQHATCTRTSSPPPPSPFSHHSYVSCRAGLPRRTVVQTSCVPPDVVTSGIEMVAKALVAVADAMTPPVLVLHQEEPPTAPPPPLPHTSLLPRTRLFSPAQSLRASQPVLYAWPRTRTTPESAARTPFGTVPRPDVTRTMREGL